MQNKTFSIRNKYLLIIKVFIQTSVTNKHTFNHVINSSWLIKLREELCIENKKKIHLYVDLKKKEEENWMGSKNLIDVRENKTCHYFDL